MARKKGHGFNRFNNVIYTANRFEETDAKVFGPRPIPVQKAIETVIIKSEPELKADGRICYGCKANIDSFCRMGYQKLPVGGNCNIPDKEYGRKIERF